MIPTKRIVASKPDMYIRIRRQGNLIGGLIQISKCTEGTRVIAFLVPVLETASFWRRLRSTSPTCIRSLPGKVYP